jgi:hypothetical protein
MSPLERSCRRLLRAFPRDYRERFGEEMLSTLLASHGGRHRPPMREFVAMIVAGAQMRLAGEHFLKRAASLQWAGMIAVAALAYMAALASGVHLRGRWAEPLPAAFAPAWILIAVWPTVTSTLPLRQATRRVVILISLAAIIVGPPGTLVSRTMLFAAGWFIVVIASVPRQRLRHSILAAATGASIGLLAANEVTSKLAGLGPEDLLPHLPSIVTMSVTWEADVFTVLYLAAMVLAVLATCFRPSIGMTVGLIAVPTVLVMIASSDDLLFYGWRGRPASTPPPTLLVGLLSLLCLLIANARVNGRHRRAGAAPPVAA